MSQFDTFVVFAEMRTGSNFLEANINSFDGLTCHGEAFNPSFIGTPDNAALLGISRAGRDKDPFALLNAIKSAKGINGFRYFNNHDPRILDHLIADERCAKIILTRNPVESFVSWKIASATGQWKLTNVTHAKKRKVQFNKQEFETHLAALQAFQVQLLNGLQKQGQTAFYVAYEDLQDVDVMNGLARYLGVEGEMSNLNKSLKKQNPMPMSEKVTDFAGMESSLARLDRFNLNRTPNFEPRRGPMIPTYIAAPTSSLLFMPIKSGPEAAVCDWLGRLDGVTGDDVQRDFTHKSVRQWMQSNIGHRSFSVLRHPLARLHHTFCHHILQTGDGCFREIRETLRRVHRLEIPDEGALPETDPQYTMAAHRDAFMRFLEFVRANLAAQTAVRVDAAWASQQSILHGMAGFAVPDMLLREDRLRGDLAMLAGQLGKTSMPEPQPETDQFSARLAAIYDPALEAAAREACARDYLAFGFRDWQRP